LILHGGLIVVGLHPRWVATSPKGESLMAAKRTKGIDLRSPPPGLLLLIVQPKADGRKTTQFWPFLTASSFPESRHSIIQSSRTGIRPKADTSLVVIDGKSGHKTEIQE
jgi:hypothetical protein